MEGWESASVGDICDVVNGGTPKTGVPDYWGGPHRWITPAEMGKRATPYIDQTDRTLTDQGLENSSARPLPPYSVILSSRAPIGHLVINTEPMATNQGCKGLVPRSRIEHKFLYYYLGSIVDLLNALGTGATFKELSGGKLKKVPVPVPPIAEQRRIVAILDEAFEAIATAKANAEKNLQNARATLDAVREDAFSALSASSELVRLGAACDFENGDRGKNYPGKQHRVAQGVPFINAGHLTEEGIDFGSMDYISPERFSLLGHGKIRPDDILFCLRGSLGKFSSVGSLSLGAIASSLVILRPGKALLHGYLLAYLASRQCADMINSHKGGAAQPNLGATDLKQFVLPLPALSVQHDVVERLDEIQALTRSLGGIYSAKAAALDELKKSLLHQAFTGALTDKAAEAQVAEVA